MSQEEIAEYVEEHLGDLNSQNILAILKDFEYFDNNFSFEIEDISKEEKRLFYKEFKKQFLKYIVDYANFGLDSFWEGEPTIIGEFAIFYYLEPNIAITLIRSNFDTSHLPEVFELISTILDKLKNNYNKWSNQPAKCVPFMLAVLLLAIFRRKSYEKNIWKSE